MPLGMAHRHLGHPELRPPKQVAQVPLNLRLVKSFVERFSVTQKQAVSGHRMQHLHVFAGFQYRGKKNTYLWHFATGSFLMSDSDHGRCDQKGNSAGDWKIQDMVCIAVSFHIIPMCYYRFPHFKII